MHRGLQWARETTHSFQAEMNMWAEETLPHKVRILASTSSENSTPWGSARDTLSSPATLSYIAVINASLSASQSSLVYTYLEQFNL